MSVKHTIQVNIDGEQKEVTLTRKKAIRYMCITCMGFTPSEVKKCTVPLCPLYPYRMGTESKG